MNFYEKNLEALQNIAPALVYMIKETPDLEWCSLIHTQSHNPNLLIRRGTKNELAYDKKNPKRASYDLVKTVNFDRGEATVVIGLGLGYLIKKIVTKKEKSHRVIVVESVLKLYQYAFKLHDFSKYILDGSLIFASPGKDEVSYIISLLETTNVISNWQVLLETYTNKRPDEYAKLIAHTIETVNQTRCNTGTVMGAGSIIAENDIRSMPFVIRHRGIVELKDLYKNKPAVLVCTGPSLEKNIHELIKIQDKVIIIAVAQALRILLAYDIRPDFITTVDFGKTNLGHYNGLMDSDVPLVCLNRTYAEILKKYQGPKFIVATPVPGYEDTAAGILTEKGFLDAGGSVAHLSLMLGYHLGCNPLMMMGQDLALTDNKSHSQQADESGVISIKDNKLTWTVKDCRSHLVTEKKDAPDYSMGMTVQVPGYFEKPVITNTGLLAFILSFKNLIKTYFNDERFVINCTEGGAHIEGTKQMTLHSAIEKYCQNGINKDVIKPLLNYADNADELIKKVIPLLEKDIKILIDTEKECKLALESNEQINKNKKDKKILNKYFKENEKHSIKAQKLATRNPLVGVAIFKASRMIHNKEMLVKGKAKHLINCEKDLNIRLERNKLILESARDESIKLKKYYEEALELLKEFDKTKNRKILSEFEEYTPSIKDAFDFFKRGNFARPLLEARKIISNYKILSSTQLTEEEILQIRKVESIALKLREKLINKNKKRDLKKEDKLLQFLELMEQNLKLGKEETKKEKPDFTKAIELLKKAHELFPENEHCLWGYATTLYHIKEYKQSIEQYNKLIELVKKKQKKLNHSKKAQEFLEKYYAKMKNETIEVPRFKVQKILRLQNKDRYYKAMEQNLLKYQFELGQVKIISGEIDEGLKDIHIVMEETNEFNHFFQRLGDIYFNLNDLEKALLSYTMYLKYYPADFIVWGKKGDCLKALGRIEEAEKAYLKLYKLNAEEKNKLEKGYYLLDKNGKQK